MRTGLVLVGLEQFLSMGLKVQGYEVLPVAVHLLRAVNLLC